MKQANALDNSTSLCPEHWHNYSPSIRNRLEQLRQFIITTAQEHNIQDLKETLKWGQLSFTCSKGTTVRIDKPKYSSCHYGLYVHCQTCLIDTYKTLYGDLFNDKNISYENNRAIIFHQDQELPTVALKHCLLLAFEYHQRKQLPLLGADIQQV